MKFMTIFTTFAVLFVTFLVWSVYNAHAAEERSIKVTWEQDIVDDFAGWSLYHKVGEDGEFSHFVDIDYNGEENDVYSVTEPLPVSENTTEEHFFYLTARDDSGNESEPSNTASIVIDLKAPSTPFNVIIQLVEVEGE